MAVLAVFGGPSWPIDSVVGFAVECAGYLFLLGGLAVRIWSILYIGGRKSHRLVTDGPYSLCRNPLYVGTLLLAIGAGLCFENLLMLIAAVGIVLPVHLIAARLEERHLAASFPTEYPAYRQQVPAFLPRLANYRRRDVLEVPVKAVRRVLLDTAAVLLLPQLEDLLEIVHQHGLLPVLWRWP